MNKVTLDGRRLTIEDLVRVSRDPAIRVEVPEDARLELRNCRAGIEQVVRSYADAHQRGEHPNPHRMYGVTTGFGEFKKIDVPPAKLNELQEKILLSHAVGMGRNEDADDPANYFAGDVVRAAIVLRINAFLKGRSGVREQLLDALVAMVNLGIVPLVPTRGSVGSSGDLCPLAHLFVTFLGEGRFYQVSTKDALRTGVREWVARPARDLPEVLSVDASVLRPRAKEGLALTNGATFSAALLAFAVHDAETLADTADATVALTLEAIEGRTEALDPRVHSARGQRGQRTSAGIIRAMVGGSSWANRTGEVQDVYSVRCAPAVHGASRDVIAYARSVVEAELNAATDNPLFFPDNQGKYVVHSAGNFHGEPVGMAADCLAIAISELGNVSERRTQMLLDENHNRDLPPNLIALPGLNSGFMIAQYTAAGLVSENKGLSHPSSVDSIPTSANTEDHVAMATTAARKVGKVISNVRGVLAIELMVASQAVEWRWRSVRERADAAKPGTSPPASGGGDLYQMRVERERAFASEFGTPAGASRRGPKSQAVADCLGQGTREVYLAVRDTVPALVEDVLLEPLFRAAREVVAEGRVRDIVRQRVGEPAGNDRFGDLAGLYRDVFNAPPWNERWTLFTARARLEELAADGAEFTIDYERGEPVSILITRTGVPADTREQVPHEMNADEVLYISECITHPSYQQQGRATRLVRRAMQSERVASFGAAACTKHAAMASVLTNHAFRKEHEFRMEFGGQMNDNAFWWRRPSTP